MSDFCHSFFPSLSPIFIFVFKRKSGRDDHADESGSSNDGGIENDALLLSMSIRHLEFEGFHFARVGGGTYGTRVTQRTMRMERNRCEKNRVVDNDDDDDDDENSSSKNNNNSDGRQ